MRLPATILLALALSSTSPHTPRTPAESRADSLFDAQSFDSLLSFSNRTIARATAQHDRVLAGRMIYHRGRARLTLRDAHAPEDFDRALAIATETGDSSGRMQALGLQAFVAVNQGRFEESIRLNRERILLARALGRRGSEAWGHMLIGYAQLNRDSLPPALAEYEEAWRGFGDAKRPRQQLAASIGLGRTLERMGRYHDARTSYQRAWLTARELGDRNQEGDAINNLGVIELEHGELSMASRYFERAYAIKRELRTFDVAATASNVADVDQMIGRYAHAESTLVEAMSMRGGSMLDASPAIYLGRIRLAQGRHAAATRCFREVLARGQSVPQKTRTEASTYLATALLSIDSIPAACAAIEDEMPGLSQGEPSGWRAEALLAGARCLRARGDLARACAVARRAWEDASARNDSSLMVTAASEASLCERAAGHDADAFDWLERARAAFEASGTTGEFQWREARRATLAGALLESGDVLLAYPRETSTETRERALFDFLQQVQSRTLLERVTDPRRFDDVNQALAVPPTSRDLQERVLAPGECFVHASVATGHIHLFVVTRDQIRSAVIEDPRHVLQRRVRNYERLCSRAPAGGAGNETEDAARALGTVLFAGTADMVRSSVRVYAALDGFLAGFPLETVVCPGESEPLGIAHETVRIPSAAFLAFLRARPDSALAESSVLAVTSENPALPGAREEADHLAARYGAARAVSPARDEFLASLSGYDVLHVASHVHVDGERPWNSGILIGAGATSPPRHAHSPAGTEPLVLSAAESKRVASQLPQDPFLRASEIVNRRTSVRLVVLSACESALGRATLAEGVLGIASSFVSAGSRAVVGSLWEVDDRTTAELMRRFYRELASGKTTAAALQSARLAMRRDRPAPFFWAGFVVIGDGDLTVSLHPRPHPALAGLAFAGLILALAWPLVIWRRRRARVRIGP